MLDNQELPIGFTMELAQHSDILNQFAKLPEAEQNNIVNGARDISSKNEMRNYPAHTPPLAGEWADNSRRFPCL